MLREVIEVIKPFLLFLKTFYQQNVHNMFAIMLDPHFKFLQIVENYVGCGKTICFASEYDVKAMIPLFMTWVQVRRWEPTRLLYKRTVSPF
jgi:hypothetical protein